MTVFELESSLVEFIAQNISELRFRSNEQTEEVIPPQVYSGYVPRDEVGSIIPGEISVYPAIIINAQTGNQPSKVEAETVTVSITIGCFDAGLNQQGYRDCGNILQRLKDRFREVDIIRERFPIRFPMSWQINLKYGGSGSGMNSFPYFFAELIVNFEVPVFSSQFDVDPSTGDETPGRYNQDLVYG